MHYVIKQKMSGTGTIHDLSGEHYDREVVFPKNKKYAVITAAYYGGPITYHKTLQAARRELGDYSGVILHRDGSVLWRNGEFMGWNDEFGIFDAEAE
jgi:threonine aldolase